MNFADDSALRNLAQFVNIMTNKDLQQSPEKTMFEDIMQDIMDKEPDHRQMKGVTDPLDLISSLCSSENILSFEDGSVVTMEEKYTQSKVRQLKSESWHQCFQTMVHQEFEALIYSVYVIQKERGHHDGYNYYECMNRIQCRCRYIVRTKEISGFYIVEEKGVHNHSVDALSPPGSHAGLALTIKEIVDTAFYNEWASELRHEKIDEEIKRLGLANNSKLKRQIDNRIAYLKRTKNVSDTQTLPPSSATKNSASTGSEISTGEILRLMMQIKSIMEQGPQQAVDSLQQLADSGINKEIIYIIAKSVKEGVDDPFNIIQTLTEKGVLPSQSGQMEMMNKLQQQQP